MRILLCFVLLLPLVGCTPESSKEKTNPEPTAQERVVPREDGSAPQDRVPDDEDLDKPDALRVDSPPDNTSQACKTDCDCKLWRAGTACENQRCEEVDRTNQCFRCGGTVCTPGKPCIDDNRKLGKCPKQIACKHDCDCWKQGSPGLCNQSGVCAALQRTSNCVLCEDKRCVAGAPCKASEQPRQLSVCGGISCKHDCDCVRDGKVCHQGKCAPLKRLSSCVSCQESCKLGTPCLERDRSIGTCKTKACSHDCDCVSLGQVCEKGQCANAKRSTQCLSCTGSCTPGKPCLRNQGGIGTCGSSNTPCSHDCECKRLGEVCSKSLCTASTRNSTCLRCSDIRCKPGTPCKKLDGSLSQCKNSACCTTAGCPAGRICCPGGVKPPPGVCGHSCDTPGPNGRCLPKP